MNSTELKTRTKVFALTILDISEKTPNSVAGRVVSNQLVRCGTSVAANYRAACRARSDREFVAKMNIVLEESDEALFWLEIIEAKKWVQAEILTQLLRESNELTSIFVRSIKTVNTRLRQSKI